MAPPHLFSQLRLSPGFDIYSSQASKLLHIGIEFQNFLFVLVVICVFDAIINRDQRWWGWFYVQWQLLSHTLVDNSMYETSLLSACCCVSNLSFFNYLIKSSSLYNIVFGSPPLEFLWIYFFCTKVLVFQLPSFTPNCVCFSTMLLKKHRSLTSNFFSFVWIYSCKPLSIGCLFHWVDGQSWPSQGGGESTNSSNKGVGQSSMFAFADSITDKQKQELAWGSYALLCNTKTSAVVCHVLFWSDQKHPPHLW